MSEIRSRTKNASGGGEIPPASGRMVTALAVCQLTSWGVLYYAVTGLILAINDDTGWSHAEILTGPMVALLASSVVSPIVGRIIDQGRGRLILNLGTFLGLASLMLWAWTAVYPVYIAAWVGIGVAQAMSLYDAAFAELTHRLGKEAKRPIVTVTLVGGFAGTLFVPLAHFLSEAVGWRVAVFVLAVLLSLNVAWQTLALPRSQATLSAGEQSPAPDMTSSILLNRAFWIAAASFTSLAAAFSIVTFHLIPMLVAYGMSEQSAALMFALIGPAQVIGRLALLFLQPTRPWRLVATLHVTLMLVFALLATADVSVSWIAVILYGLANGLQTLVRPQLIWTLFGTHLFGSLNGALAVPQQIIKAAAPVAGAYLVSAGPSYFGLSMLLLGLTFMSGVACTAAYVRVSGSKAEKNHEISKP